MLEIVFKLPFCPQLRIGITQKLYIPRVVMQCRLKSTNPAFVHFLLAAARAPTPNKPNPALKYGFSVKVDIKSIF